MDLNAAEAAAALHFETLATTIPNRGEYDLVMQHAPVIRFDVREPFLPSVVGYTVFRQDGRSASFPRDITLPPGAVYAIEYAVWWDWEIQHLYELEHVWVYVGADEQVVAVDASWHGGFHVMTGEDGTPPLEKGRAVVFSEPGKHAFAPVIDWLLKRRPTTDESCGRTSGRMGVHVTPLFDGIIDDRTPLNNNVVHAYLESLRFEPTYDFSLRFDTRTATLVPWEALNAWIPKRVKWWADYVRENTPPDQRRPLRIAHRGASAYAQEGSQASVEKAAELGADMIEIDIRVTRDEVPVIAHDSSLKRVFGVSGDVNELTLEELKAITPEGRQPVLTFDEMLDLCSRLSLGLYLDIKEITPNAMQAVIESLRRKGMMRYAIFGSFRPDLLAEIKAAAPSASTSILFSSVYIDPVALASAIKADYVHPCWERFESPSLLLTPEWIERVRSAGLGIVCWHEERPAEIAALNALGVDGICSDQPELLVR
jgi:glycerophosphoryl diester phosphodiesterase